eukprot:NODE_9333_length_373_cov_45.530864_g8430_i0.p1 GENE.NODE_9333_length_373_cov_45.530864_g8430_i0~~NODE_9333_length_373_cov_45.530864_g8430_i0.p1  ORF type:complete len:84 (-),score=21.79 NODE_9333_length_373_cov_45.530864_g8430_i0:121-348(-)
MGESENATKILSEGKLKVGELTVTTSSKGLNWFTRMLPGARSLFLVNMGLLCVHGYNIFRKVRYDQAQKLSAKTE